MSTITEKILAKASGKKSAEPGEFVSAKVHSIMTMDLLGPAVFKIFKDLGAGKTWDPEKIVVVVDHMVPPPDIRSAELQKACRAFVKEYGIGHFYDVGRHGICHQIMPEQGHVLPGTVVVGTDSHATTYGALGAFAAGVVATDAAVVFALGELWLRVPESVKFNITGELPNMVMSKDVILKILGMMGWEKTLIYKAVEFSGPAVKHMSVASRMTMCNVAAELGAKNGIIEPDEKTVEYVKKRTKEPFEMVQSDSDAEYEEVYDLDVSKLEPQVACPHLPDNVKPVTEVEGAKVDQAVLGSCTNGRLEDLEIAARIIGDKKIHPNVRLIVFPASQDVYLDAVEKGYTTTFVKAGATICPPTCGPCAGFDMGILGDDEVAISSTNRNFVGRMGSKKSMVYLASPATVAASAIKGEIVDPRKMMKEF